MDTYSIFSRIARIGVLFAILFASFSYVEESLIDTKVIDIAKKLEGEISIQFDDIDVELAVNDSTIVLNVVA